MFAFPMVQGKTLYWGDILLYFEPMYLFTQQQVAKGMVPLWNPYLFCGQPFLGNPQISFFYPTTLVFYFLPSWFALTLVEFLHLFLCGVFAFLFLNQKVQNRFSALIGAVVYMGSEFVVSRLQFPTIIQTLAFVPLLLYFIELYVNQQRLRAVLGVTLSVSLITLAAHPQTAFLTFAMATFYTLFALSSLSQGKTMRLKAWFFVRRLLVLMVAFIWGLCIASVYLIPVIQLSLISSRTEMSAGLSNRFYADIPHLINLVFPRFTGHPESADYWARGNAWEPTLFVGWVPLICIFIALHKRWKQSDTRFWALLGGLGLWLSMGNSGGLFYATYYLVPGVSLFHDPARFLLWTCLAFVVLTAKGCDVILEKNKVRTKRVKIVALLLTALPLWWFGRDWNPMTEPSKVSISFQADARNGRAFSTSNYWAWRRLVNDGYSDYATQDEANIRWLAPHLPQNLAMRGEIAVTNGYEPVPISSALDMSLLLEQAFLRNEPTLPMLTGLSGTEQITLGNGMKNRYNGFAINESSNRLGTEVWEPIEPVSLAWMTRKTRRVDGVRRALFATNDSAFNYKEVTIVSGEPDSGGTELEFADVGNTKPVEILEMRSNRVLLKVDAGSRPGFVVYAGAAYPGWKAKVNGQSRQIRRANGAFMGIGVDAGVHQIELYYDPDHLRVAMYLSLVAFSLFVSVGVMDRLLHKKTHG